MEWNEIDRDLACRAEAQHGLLANWQVTTEGIGRNGVLHRLATGQWDAVARGVYRLAGTQRTWHQSLLAAVLAAGPGAVASHREQPRCGSSRASPVPPPKCSALDTPTTAAHWARSTRAR